MATGKYGNSEIWRKGNSEPIVPLIITGFTPKQVSRKYGDLKIWGQGFIKIRISGEKGMLIQGDIETTKYQGRET